MSAHIKTWKERVELSGYGPDWATRSRDAEIAELRSALEDATNNAGQWQKIGEKAVDDLIACSAERVALASQGVAAPAGYAIVPLKPTEAMHAAAVRTLTRCAGNADFPPRVYAAMLSAAPQPPAVKEAEPTSQRHDSRTAYESLDLKGRRRMDETLARVDQMIQDAKRRKHPDRRQHVAPVEVERRVADARGTGIHQDRKQD